MANQDFSFIAFFEFVIDSEVNFLEEKSIDVEKYPAILPQTSRRYSVVNRF